MPANSLRCANCHRPLDATDKFCRDCGLPTLHRAEAHAQMPVASPDTSEMQRALDAAPNGTPDPRPFLREEPAEVISESASAEPMTTGEVVRATNPTFVAQLASSTALMVGVMVVLVVAGVLMLFFAFRP